MNIAITGIGPMIPCAVGAGSLPGFDLDRMEAEAPDDWFDPEIQMGGRGFKYFGNATRYLLAAARQMDGGAVSPRTETDSAEGIMIGSNSCARRVLEEFDFTLLREGYLGINPMRAAEFCPNMGAGTLSMKRKSKAFNITLMNPITAGLDAVILSAKSISAGRATGAFAGAMEDETRLTLGQGIPVRTRGGSWTVRLEAVDKLGRTPSGRKPIVFLGASYQGFIPPDASGKPALRDPLEDRLAALFSAAPFRASIASLTDPHSRNLVTRISRILARAGVSTDEIITTRGESGYATLLAMAQLSWMGLHAESSICFAVSPLGHISALRIFNSNPNPAMPA